MATVLLLVVVGAATIYRLRWTLWAQLSLTQRIAVLAIARGVSVQHDLRITMHDGVELATSVYLPGGATQRRPTILIRLPYHRLQYVEGYQSALDFASEGYAVVVQDLRGTGDSGGQLLPWHDAGEDGVSTLDWIVRQPWSNGRVGTFGCSALGETQYVLARLNHPAHRAMVASGAGGGAGSVGGRHAYFGLFEGGVFQLASGFGWFVTHGAKDPKAPAALPFDLATHLRELPVSKLVERVRSAPNGYSDFLAMPLSDARWEAWGYYAETDRSRVPALAINTWGDQTLAETFALAEAWRSTGTPQKVVIAPGNHCEHDAASLQRPDARFGDLPLHGAAFAWRELYGRWFRRWLRDEAEATDDMPAYTYYMIGENRWLSATSWPPTESTSQRWVLASGGNARGREGNGSLSLQPNGPSAAHDEYRYDPMDPVPSRGGPLCCTGNPKDRSGPVDQADVEGRNDVLVYTSTALEEDLRIAGPVRAQVVFSSNAPDTDLVVRVVHVWPDGRAIGIQEGTLRLRYREGYAEPRLLVPGEQVIVQVDMRSIAYRIPKGHRLRLHVTSSSFPRLERNLNTGARNNAEEERCAVAINRVHHTPAQRSWLQLAVLPPAAP